MVKLFPFWWLVPPPVVELEEGEYSSYAAYDTFADSDASNGFMRQDAVFNTGETMILIFDGYSIVVKAYTIASKTLGAAIKSDILWHWSDASQPGISWKSAYGKYVVVMGYSTTFGDCDKIYIFKDGALLQTLEDGDLGIDADSIRAVAISPTGKYVVVSGPVSGSMKWVLLQGS